MKKLFRTLRECIFVFLRLTKNNLAANGHE